MNINIGKSKDGEIKYRNKGFNRAQLAQTAVVLPSSILSLGILAKMKKVSQITQEDSVALSKAVQAGLKKSGLYKKGVRVYKIQEAVLPKLKDLDFKSLQDIESSEALKSLSKSFKISKGDIKAVFALTKEFSSNKLMKRIFSNKSVKKYVDFKTFVASSVKRQVVQLKLGLNAFFLPNANKIVTPSKSLQTSVFHEMGHAMNANGILKGLQKIRPVGLILPGVILTLSLLNKHKAKDDINPNDSKIQQGKDFVKKHAGLLTGLAFVPMVLEEGIASLRGQGIAKKLVSEGKISKELFKKVKLTNLCGFSSYALTAITAVAAAKIGIAVKDKVQEKYEAKKMAKLEK